MLPVVVSGLGVVGPYGVGWQPLAVALGRGTPPPTVEVERSRMHRRGQGSRRALSAAGLDLTALLPGAAARRLSPPARFAVAAARLALADAGLDEFSSERHRATAVVSGTAFGPAWVTEQLLGQIFGAGPEAASPALFAESVASAAASQVALALGARGPNVAFTGREASDLLALGHGYRLVASGRAERALVVVVDEMTPLLHAVLDRFHALARPEPNGTEWARPFDRRRTGLIASEGAVVALLEPAETVAARGHRVHATLTAAGAGFDPSASAHDFGRDPATIVGAVRAGLERLRARGGAQVPVATIDRVVAGAAGTRRGDALLGRAVAGLFAPQPPPALLAPKGTTGEYGGGFLAAALLCSGDLPLGPTVGFAQDDPEIGVSPHTGALLAPPRRSLALSAAAGGAFAWALFEAPAAERRFRIRLRSDTIGG